MLCTSGEGYFQEKGKPIQLLKSGDVVEIKPNVEHWHGATPNGQFVHVGITPRAKDNQVTWLTPVTNKEYSSFS